MSTAAKTKKGKEIPATKRLQEGKTADELNKIIGRHLDALENPKATMLDIRIAETVSNLIGKQMKVESIKIAYESLRMKNGIDYKF